MTNSEKFKEVFGFQPCPTKETMNCDFACGVKYGNCNICRYHRATDFDMFGCNADDWWMEEYKERRIRNDKRRSNKASAGVN